MITHFYPLIDGAEVGAGSTEEAGSGAEPIRVRTNYFEPLSSVLDKFNQNKFYNKTGVEVSKLYNKYGQEIPLTYRVQKTGLEVYFSAESAS